MVTSVTSFGRSGLYDWVVQRVTAVLLAGFFVFLLGWLVLHPDLEYAQWHELFATTWMKVFSTATLFAICAHGWIGMWTIWTDYLTPNMVGSNATLYRFLAQIGCVAFLFTYLVWGIQILWGG